MKITQITYTARKGLPSYSHEEIIAVATISEENQTAQILELKNTVDGILNGNVKSSVTQTVVENKQVVVENAPVEVAPNAIKSESAVAEAAIEAKPKRERKATVKEAADGTVTAQLGTEPAAVLNIKPKAEVAKEDKTIEKYDRSVKEHTSTFAAHLTKTFGETWKTKEGLKTFSESLNGEAFRDSKTGLLVDSFKQKINAFFGDSGNVL